MAKRSIFEKVVNKEGKQVSKYVWEALPKELILDKNVSDRAFRLYAILTTYVNFDEDGNEKAWPSFNELMEVTGWGKDKLGIAIDELVEKGWIGNIISEQQFNYQNNYYLNNTANVNNELVARRRNKHDGMSKAAKARLAAKKDGQGTLQMPTTQNEQGYSANADYRYSVNAEYGYSANADKNQDLKNQDLKNPILIQPASQDQTRLANAQTPSGDLDSKDRLYKFVRTKYGLSPTPEAKWLEAFESAFNGTHKKSTKPISPEHLLDYWMNSSVSSEIFNRSGYKFATKDKDGYKHSLYALSCLIGEYDKYISERDRIRIANEESEQRMAERRNGIDITEMGRIALINRKKVAISNDDDDDDEDE